MRSVIAVVLIAVAALVVPKVTVHVLSPWLLEAIAVVAWIEFRPRRSRSMPSRTPSTDGPAAGTGGIAGRPDDRWGDDWLHRTYPKLRARSH